MKKQKIMKWLNHSVTVLLFTVLISVVTLVLMTKLSGGEPEVFGYQFKTVLSGSMEPGIQTGSVIAVNSGGDMTRFTKGDVITFQDKEGRFITHRVTEATHSDDQMIYRTKGDSNNAEDADSVLSENVVAEYTGTTIPYLGYLVHVAQTQNGAFLLLIPGILLLIYSGFTIWKALARMNVDHPQSQHMVTESDEHLMS